MSHIYARVKMRLEIFLLKIQNSKLKIQNSKQWPCYFFKSDTTGEKDFEEFFTDNETLDMKRFENLGVIKNLVKMERCLDF